MAAEINLDAIDAELVRRGIRPEVIAALSSQPVKSPGTPPVPLAQPQPGSRDYNLRLGATSQPTPPVSFMGPKPEPTAPDLQPTPPKVSPTSFVQPGEPARPASIEPAATAATPIQQGAPPVSFAKRYEDEQARGQQDVASAQQNADSAKPSLARKLLAVGAGVLGGVPRGQEVWNQPRTDAEAKVQQTQKESADRLAGIKTEASIADTESQARERDARTSQIQNAPDRPEDKKIDEYVNDEGKRTLTFQRSDGTVYDRVGGQTLEKGTDKNIKEQLQRQIADADAKGDKAAVKTLQARLKAIDPEGQQRIVIQQGNAEDRKKNEADKISRQDVREHDKAYVVPAEAVEKSYQMMDSAYKEYQSARAQGKELPTGAQSMLALSTHLSTTFGNVKGSRITKDMIEHHLGARGISDSAVVAVQKLTNGDVLSPDQWEAFHNLIGESRKLSWQTAVKEANRKNIPVDFLPDDLQNLKTEGTGSGSGGGIKIKRDANGRIVSVE